MKGPSTQVLNALGTQKFIGAFFFRLRLFEWENPIRCVAIISSTLELFYHSFIGDSFSGKILGDA